MTIDEIMRAAPVIPVLVLDGSARPGRAGRDAGRAGLPVVEVTLRTPVALDAIRAMATVPGAIVGAGTVSTNPARFGARRRRAVRRFRRPDQSAGDGGARCGRPVPARSGECGRHHARARPRPRPVQILPGRKLGRNSRVKSLVRPVRHLRFCPTGGITAETAAGWLALDAVLCVGGSWLIRPGETDLALVDQRARKAAALSTEN